MLGRMDEACAAARSALALAPHHIGALTCLASALRGTRRHTDAEQVTRGLATLDPAQPATYGSLQRATKQQGDASAALNAARRLVALSPADVEARRALGSAMFEIDDGPDPIRILAGCEPNDRTTCLTSARIDSVEAYCTRHHQPYFPLAREEAVECDPRRYPGVPPPFRTPAGFVARIDEVLVLPTSLALLGRDGSLMADLVSPYPLESLGRDAAVAALATDGRALLRLQAEPGRLDEPAMLLGSTSNFTHDVIDLLPRLMTLEPQTEEIVRLPIVICRGASKGFRRLVEIVLDRPVDFVELDDKLPTRCRRLWMPSLTHRFNHYNPSAVAFVRDRLPTRRRLERSSGERRLYLTRRNALHRRLANEKDIESILARYGFETVAPESMTLDAQLDMFADAEFIILPSGGGNATPIFAPRGTKIIEICHDRMLSRHVVTFACFLGHPYRRVVGTTMGNVGALDFDWDFEIAPNALEQAIMDLAGC